MKETGSQFLHQRDPNLHLTPGVEATVDYLRASGQKIPNEPAAKIETYLGFLADKNYVNDGILTGDETSVRRQIEARVIDEDDVPDSYFELQRRIAREQGHGDITITQDIREQLIDAVQADQRSGLENWVEYLGGDDGEYPNWFKTYAWESVTKLGNFDKTKQQFRKRSESTTAPYPELNREALAYVYNSLCNSRLDDQQPIDNEELRKLIAIGNFGKLYAHAVLEVTPDSPENKKSTEGSWKKFNQTDDPRIARRLAESLRGHGTGWCTAGEKTATIQLEHGDFYVYYTEDQQGKQTVPRVAIRMQAGEVAEVRGVNAGQELEPVFADVTAEMLSELPGGDKYTERFENMKQLTELEHRITQNPSVELTRDELSFLYELEREIEGFGYDRDPRINELQNLRNAVNDLNQVFEGIDQWDGDLQLDMLSTAEGLKFPQNIRGTLNLFGLVSAEGLTLPHTIEGSLDLYNMRSAEGLQLPFDIGGSLFLAKLTNANGLKLPHSIGRHLSLENLTSAEGLDLPLKVGGDLNLREVRAAKGMNLPNTVGGNLLLSRLSKGKDLRFPDSVGGVLDLSNLHTATKLRLPKHIGGDLQLHSLDKISETTFPESIDGSLYMGRLMSVDVLELPETVGGGLLLNDLYDFDILRMPHFVGGDLLLDRLSNDDQKGLVFPEVVGGSISMYRLSSARGVELPKTISGYSVRVGDDDVREALTVRHPEHADKIN